MTYRTTRTAESQIEAILVRSARQHGTDAAGRYDLLVLAAFAAVAANPNLLGHRTIPDLPGIRAYPLRLTRDSLPPALRIRTPSGVSL